LREKKGRRRSSYLFSPADLDGGKRGNSKGLYHAIFIIIGEGEGTVAVPGIQGESQKYGLLCVIDRRRGRDSRIIPIPGEGGRGRIL